MFIRGERPIKDFKYDILRHPNVDYTADGKGEIYIHKKDIAIDTKDNFGKYDTYEKKVEEEFQIYSNKDF